MDASERSESMEHERIEYTSDNGYRGILYGVSSMVIYDEHGKEIMHTAFRTPNTLDELKEIVDTMPEFIETLDRMMEGMNK